MLYKDGELVSVEEILLNPDLFFRIKSSFLPLREVRVDFRSFVQVQKNSRENNAQPFFFSFMKISAFVALAGVSAQAPAGRIYFDEDLPCSDFDAMFPSSQFPDMKTKCKTKFNEKKNKTKTRCNLICKNGQENVWSTRPIKVRSGKMEFRG